MFLGVELDFENFKHWILHRLKPINTVTVLKNADGNEVNQHIGIHRGGKTTKLHTLVDGLGNPLAFLLTGGRIYDSVPAIDLLQEFDITESPILGDKAHGSKAIRNWITAKQESYIIPPKANSRNPWKVDWYLYKERPLVECFLNKIKHFRRVSYSL